MSASTESTEVNEPSQAVLDLAKAKSLIGDDARNEATEDELIVKLITEGGFNYRKATRLMTLALQDLGLKMSAKDRYEAVCEILTENGFAPDTYEDVEKVVGYLAEELESTTEKQALVAVRRFAKEQDIDIPKKPKGGGGGRGPGFRGEIITWMIDNATEDDATFTKWLEGHGKGKGYANHYITFRDMARKIHAKLVEAGT